MLMIKKDDNISILITIESDAWVSAWPDAKADIARAAWLCLERAMPELSTGQIEISVLLCDDAAIQDLNRNYRGKDKPTNVLSFPQSDIEDIRNYAAGDPPVMLGDIIMAHETITREAQEQNKDLHDHIMHMIVHSILHLLGYDHTEEKDAEEMEKLEITILKTINIKNPY